MGVSAPDAKLLGMATENEEGTEVALRIEVLGACGLERLDGGSSEAALAADAEQAGYRAAVTVFGQVVYAASGLRTQNPVRLGGLPRGTDLAIAVLPPAGTSSADLPLLATAPLALGMMRACGKPVSPQEGWPAGALNWEGSLPLSLCSSEGNGLTEGAFGDARIRVSVLIEEPEHVSVDVAQEPQDPDRVSIDMARLEPFEPGAANEPQATVSSMDSCLSSSVKSMSSEAVPTPQIEKVQSFRLERPSMHEASEEAQPLTRPTAAGFPGAHLLGPGTASKTPPHAGDVGLLQRGDFGLPFSQVPAQSTELSQPEGPAVSPQLPQRPLPPSPAAMARLCPSTDAGPRMPPANLGAQAASVPVALSVVAPASAASNRATGPGSNGVGSSAAFPPGKLNHGGSSSANSSISAAVGSTAPIVRTAPGSDRAPCMPGYHEAVPAERSTALGSTAGCSSQGSSVAASAGGPAPTLRESALQLENSRLLAELESSRQEVDLLRHRREEDHQMVQEKLQELEIEVRSRWQKRVSDLEAEVALLKQSLATATGAAAINASTLSADTDALGMSQVQQQPTVAAYPSNGYLPAVGGVGRCGGGPAGHHSAVPPPVLQWPELSDPTCEGPLLEGPRLGISAADNCLHTPLRSSPSMANSPALGSPPPLGSPEPAWPAPQLATSLNPFGGSSLQSPVSGMMPPNGMGNFAVPGGRVCIDAAASAAVNLQAPGGLLPPPGLKVQGLGPINLQQIDFLERSNSLQRFCETTEDSASDSTWPPSGQASRSSACGPAAKSSTATSAAKRRDSRPPSPPRPSPPPPPSRPSPSSKVQPIRADVSPIPVSVEPATSTLCTAPATARAGSPELRELDIRTLRNDPNVVLKHRSQSVPIMARASKAQADDKGLLGFFEAFGGLYSQLVQGTKCTGPDALAVNERLVEIDLSAEFPPERRAAQVDLVGQALMNKTRM